MEFVILGLLALHTMTLYEINKALEKSISLFYSASFGSINIALNKMFAKGWVTTTEKVEGGRNKKFFSLTPLGRQVFQEWLASEILPERVKDLALTRMFFMGLLPAEQRIAVLEVHLGHLQDSLAALDVLHERAASVQAPAGMEAIIEYQRLTLQYGRDYYTFNINWYRTLLENLKDPRMD